MINLKNVSNKTLIGLEVLHGILYTLFILVIPCFIISVQYDIFKNAESGLRLTGIGLIVFLGALFFGLGKLKKLIDSIPVDAEGWKAVAKALLTFAYDVLLPIIILVIAFFVQENVVVALTCIRLSVISILIGAVENLILGSSVRRWSAITSNAARMKNAKSREDKF